MKTRPITEADRVKIRQQFPGAYRVLVAAETLRQADAEHKDAILLNRRGRTMDNAEERTSRAVDAVSMMVKIMQEGA